MGTQMVQIKEIYVDFYRDKDLHNSKLSLFLFLFIILIVSQSTAKDIVVSPGSNISSIKQAIELSKPGDRIIIKKGFYSEANIIIDKSVELKGEDYPEIDGANQFQIITVKANNVKISGLVIKNSGASNLNDLAGIRMENVKSCVIENNRLKNNFFGIALYGCSLCTISTNKIVSNAVSESSSGNGVHLWKCDSVTVENNNISGHRDGIYFEFVTNSKIINNVSKNNLRYGLHFMFSHYDSYEYNTFANNGAGVAVMYTKHVEMTGNRFDDNRGPNSYGLLLKDISDSYICKNTFNRNTTAVYMEGGARINIIENNFNGNGWAMKVLGDCSQDTVIHNNFETNTFDVATNSSKNNNFFSENYWNKYSGYDINKDNIGDVPYRPVSLFSIMIEKTPETLFLLRSFVADLLDLAEKVAPVFIPETLVDERPLMKQYGMVISKK
jgi:nitrous oxidase accessory protein